MPFVKIPPVKKIKKIKFGLLAGINFPIAALIIILLVGFFIFHSKKSAVVPPASNGEAKNTKSIEKKPEAYSRVTFFFTEPIKGSLAIPESWEGSYRMSGINNVVDFIYIGSQTMTTGLFTVKEYSKADWGAVPEKKGTVIAEQDSRVFVYEKAQNNPYTGDDSEKYLKIFNRVDEVIKSFKGFKL